jgi:hypothetical protein
LVPEAGGFSLIASIAFGCAIATLAPTAAMAFLVALGACMRTNESSKLMTATRLMVS